MAKTIYILLGAKDKSSPMQFLASGNRTDALAAVASAPEALTQFQLGRFAFERTVKRGEREVQALAGGSPEAPTCDDMRAAIARIEKLEAMLAESRNENLALMAERDSKNSTAQPANDEATAPAAPEVAPVPPIADAAQATTHAMEQQPQGSLLPPAGEPSPAGDTRGDDGPRLRVPKNSK